MALNDLDYIRLVLTLPHRVILAEELGTGDGTNKKFLTQLIRVIDGSETIRVNGVAKTLTTDYTIDNETGLVTFVVAPPDTHVVDADYTWSVFSDLDINGLLTKFNNAVVTVLQALVLALLSNTDLFVKYTEGMESMDRTAALKALEALQEQLIDQPASPVLQAVIWRADDVTAYERDVAWADFVDSTPED